jgi:methionyl-tRNA formyltransferase
MVWKIPPYGTINLHASLLPQYRGAAPINHVLFNGETTSGVTTFFIDENIDTGEILGQRKVSIGSGETAGELHDRLMILGADLVVDTVQRVLEGTAKPTRQQQLSSKIDSLKTAPKLQKEDLKINWSESVDKVYNKIRGLSPLPGAYTRLYEKNGKLRILKIFKTEKLLEEKNIPPGTIRFEKKKMMIACKNGMLSLKEVQLEGKKRMTIENFILGIETKNILKAE